MKFSMPLSLPQNVGSVQMPTVPFKVQHCRKMASLVQKYCIFIVWIFSLIFSISQGKINSLLCNEGYDVSFECPCPEELNECRFKKQGDYIVRNGLFSVHSSVDRYQFNEHKTHITLKECNEDDEGTYVWMCGRCNVSKHFDLKVQNISEVSVIEEKLRCPIGGEISYQCPCAELQSCRLKKRSQGGYYYIVKDGLRNAQITLKGCDEDDEGTYVWMCGRYNVRRQFHLEVQVLEVQGLDHNQETTGDKISHLISHLVLGVAPFIPVVYFCMVCCTIIKGFARKLR